MRPLFLMLMLFGASCGSGRPLRPVDGGDVGVSPRDGHRYTVDGPHAEAKLPHPEARVRDLTTEGAGCAAAAHSEDCVQCCRLPQSPNYGGFELYAYEICSDCPDCAGLSPCGTNVTPPGGVACVKCLLAKLAADGLPSSCANVPACKAFTACLQTCPLK